MLTPTANNAPGEGMTRYVSWCEYAAEVIARVIADHRGLPEAEMRKRISEAYPYGERRMWPYRCWLRQVRLALRREYGTGEGTRFSDERQETLAL